MLFNDVDREGDRLTPSVDTQAAHGTAVCPTEGNTCTYTANAGYTGPDTFSYRVVDDHGGSATARVDVTVEENGAPVAAPDKALAHGVGTRAHRRARQRPRP